MSIAGKFFNGVVSKQFDAELVAGTSDVSIRLINNANEALPEPTSLSEMAISSRLDSVPRSLRFPTGQQFLTDDNNAIDALIKSHGLTLVSTLAHRLESYLPLVVTSLVCIVLSGFGFVKYGIPAIAENAADLVPESVQISMGESVLNQFSKNGYLSESLIDAKKRDGYRSYLVSFNDPDDGISILFRNSSIFGPNAFALPGGNVVLTDELVQLAGSDEELLAVYFHELGHIKYKHIIKQGLQSSLLSLFVITITGDLTAATDLVSGVPTVLLSLNYSRNFEIQADQYALARLEAANIDAMHFANIMHKLMRPSVNSAFFPPEYLSTHPAPDDRLALIESHSTLPVIRDDSNTTDGYQEGSFDSADRFQGAWSVSIFSDVASGTDGVKCTYGEGEFSINNGAIRGKATSNFRHRYSFTGTVDEKGESFWIAELTESESLSFNGVFEQDSGSGSWQTLNTHSRETVDSCRGTWVTRQLDGT